MSMSTWAARKLAQVIEMLGQVLGMEYLGAAQGLEFNRPLTSSDAIEAAVARLRERVPRLEDDRYLAVETAPRVELELTAAELDHLRSLGYVR